MSFTSTARVRRFALVLGAVALVATARAETVFSVGGSDPASIQATVDAFRASLGTLNPNVPGSFVTGRREINWDGVPDARSAPNLLPADFFNVNSPRGAVFSGPPGTTFQVSADASNPTNTPVEFGNIDPAYTGFFSIFSPQRLFTSIGAHELDVSFFVPGSNLPSLTRGFGAVFSDVDFAHTTTLSFFDAANQLIQTFEVEPATVADQGLSFLGVDFGSAIVSRVHIVSGDQTLAAGNTLQDLVVMDDFIYGEPIPEPGTWALLVAGLLTLGWVARRRR